MGSYTLFAFLFLYVPVDFESGQLYQPQFIKGATINIKIHKPQKNCKDNSDLQQGTHYCRVSVHPAINSIIKSL